MHLFNLGKSGSFFSLLLLWSYALLLCQTYSFHVVSLFLSLPISLCSFCKCIAVCFKSFTLSVCLPAFPSGTESVVMY